jgi:hypothetical protein
MYQQLLVVNVFKRDTFSSQLINVQKRTYPYQLQYCKTVNRIVILNIPIINTNTPK